MLEVFRGLGAEGLLSALDVEPEKGATTDWFGICFPHGGGCSQEAADARGVGGSARARR